MGKLVSLTIVILFFFSCTEKIILPADTNQKYGNDLNYLASTIRMSDTIFEVPILDYFPTIEIDSVTTSTAGFSAKLDSSILKIRVGQNSTEIGVITCWKDGFSYDLMCMKPKKIPTIISFTSTLSEKVELAGEMNNWSPQQMTKVNDKQWSIELNLDPGSYQYQLVVDGTWQIDPSNSETEENGIGGINSLLKIGDLPTTENNYDVIEASDSSISINVSTSNNQCILFWNNHRIDGHNGLYKIPKIAYARKRSHVRIWIASSNGNVSDFLIPLEFGAIVKNTGQLSRMDKHNSVLYFALVDRFANGNPKNDSPLVDDEVHPKANYWGGDIKGITEKIKEGYFSGIGVNTIWLSPITQNPMYAEREFPPPHRMYSGYHGYWPISASKIDHRFGNEAELKELVSNAHKNNLNVILDYVSNHVHEDNPIIKENPHWSTPLVLPNGKKNIRIWDEQRLTTWFDEFLPTLDYSKPEVVELMSDSALYMLRKYELDGFRHDATKHIPSVYWRTLTKKIKLDIRQPIYQIGETFGSRQLIGSYVRSGQLDGQFDFNLYFDLRNTLASNNGSFIELYESLKSSFSNYGNHSLMGNITGNHDIPRFISYAGGGLSFMEDEKKAGWSRKIEVLDTLGYRKLELLTAFITTIPGIPTIYYGDEIGMPGAGDPDNRMPMKFTNLSYQENKVKRCISDLIHARRNRMSLIYGDFQLVSVTKKTIAYTRTYFKDSTLGLINNSNKEVKVTHQNTELQVLPYSETIIFLEEL